MILETITNIKLGLQKYLFNLIFSIVNNFIHCITWKNMTEIKVDMEKNYFFNIIIIKIFL